MWYCNINNCGEERKIKMIEEQEKRITAILSMKRYKDSQALED